MLGWAIGFFIAALVAAVFGFGGIASAFAGIAVILFWVFVALFVLSLLFGAFGGTHAAGAGGSGRTAATLALVAGVALLVYAWVDNGMSAQRVGASIDRTAVQVADGASDAIGDAGNRVEDITQNTTDAVRQDASQGLDEASDRAAPDGNGDNNH
jgi:uncharacterized membrane protein YtjA (UPF0391 family)